VAYSATIVATGGSGSGYLFSATQLAPNGPSFPPSAGAGIPISGIFSDNLYAYSGLNTLYIFGTPTTTGTVTLYNVTVKDSAGDTAGPDTYTIAVNPE
jgi:hypothetical protein